MANNAQKDKPQVTATSEALKPSQDNDKSVVVVSNMTTRHLSIIPTHQRLEIQALGSIELILSDTEAKELKQALKAYPGIKLTLKEEA